MIKNTNGTVNLTKIGTGTLTLSGNNQYEGVTKVEQGTLSITDRVAQHDRWGDGCLQRPTLNLNVGGVLWTISERLELNGTGVGAAGVDAHGHAEITLTGSVTLPTNASVGVADGRTLTLSGKISGSGGLTKVGLGILTSTMGPMTTLGTP